MRGLIYAMDLLATAVVSGLWLSGVVLAAGWMKVAAAFFPPYAFYLVAEAILQKCGLVA